MATEDAMTEDTPKDAIELPKEKPDGIIRWEIPNVSKYLGHYYSQVEEFNGISWELYASKVNEDGEDRIRFSVFTNRNIESTLWKCNFTYSIMVKNQDSSKDMVIKNESECEHHYTLKSSGVCAMSWSALNDPEQGFLSSDKLMCEGWIYIKKVSGTVQMPRFDFSTATENLSDVILLIGDKKVHVSKQILALYSSFFHTMFYGNFAEKNKDEIELKEIEYEEFIELLHVIYPSRKKITDDSAAYLLKLGDRFEINCVVEGAERHLIASSRIVNTEKLRLADQYRLYKLQEHCLSQLNTSKEVVAVKNSPVYTTLSETSRVALFERIAKFA